MMWHRRNVWQYAVVATLLVSNTTWASDGTTSPETLKEANIIFIGTVRQLESTSFATVPKSSRTLVVSVDQVLEEPNDVSIFPGSFVTVEVKDPSLFREGVKAEFYTQGWIFGRGVAVKEVGHELMPAAISQTALKNRREDLLKLRKRQHDGKVVERLRTAEFVVTGKVVDIKEPQEPAVGRPRSLHDPHWMEALVQIQSVMKGKTGREITLYFPGSGDIAWRGTPKFKVGDEGVLIVHKTTVATSGAELTQAYTTLSSLDVLPITELHRVRNFVQELASH